MTGSTYYVFEDGSGWTIQNDGNNYVGYKTRVSALRAAIAIAEKLDRNGLSVQVKTKAPDDTWKTEWPIDVDPLFDFR